MLGGYTWPQVDALYRHWKFYPPIEVITASYFKLPTPADEEEPESMMPTEDAVALFMMAGFTG